MYDVYEIRKQFPMLTNDVKMQNKPLVFLDNCSTTFKPQCVIDAEMEYYTKQNSNSHRGDYDLSYQADVKIEEARKASAHFVNCETDEVVFTSGTTAGLNLVAYGYALDNLKQGDQILLSIYEHASNVLPWYRICELTGAEIIFAELENKRVTPKTVTDAFNKHKNIKLVALAHVGNVLGYIIDIKKIAKIVHEHNAVVVVDGAQSVPHMPVDVEKIQCDALIMT